MPRDVTFDNSQTFTERRLENARAKWLPASKARHRSDSGSLARFDCAFRSRVSVLALSLQTRRTELVFNTTTHVCLPLLDSRLDSDLIADNVREIGSHRGGCSVSLA